MNAAFCQAKFGVQLGGNVSFAQTESNEDDELSNDPRFGLVAGFVADVPMGPLSFRPEINFIQKGFANDETINFLGTTYKLNTKYRMNYVEVPLNVVYNIEAGAGKVFLGLGPNFAFGLSGKVKSDNGSGDKTTADIKFDGNENPDDDNIHFKRFDFGGNLLAGYQTGMGLYFNLGFTLGLVDVLPNNVGNEDASLKNHNVNLKIGYLFGCNRASKKTTTTTTTGM